MGPSDRVQVIDYPTALPSKCAICGASPTPDDPRRWVDFGLSLEFYGVVYFCTFCVANVAEAINFVGPGVYYSAIESAEKLSVEVETLRFENEEFRRVYSTLSGLGAVVPNNDGSNNRRSANSSRKSKADTKPDAKPHIPEQRSDESSSVEGSGDVSTFDGDNDAESDGDLSF